jgi:hypothetical protein
MLSLAVYKTVHLISVMAVFLGLGAVSAQAVAKATGSPSSGMRKLSAALHGSALLLILVSGFGMLARLALTWPLPAWAWMKLLVWVFFGGALVAAKRSPKNWKFVWGALLVMGAWAAYLGIHKPGA